MGVHDGHRKRIKERFAENGLDGFNDHNAVELLLFYALPRKDTNELAHKLLKHFGSLTALLEADYSELCAFDGIGENAAVLLKLIPQLSKRYQEQKSLPAKRITCIEAAGNFFVAKFMYETNEYAYGMFLDSKNAIINIKQISSGVVNATEIGVRQLVETALKCKASGVILAHNHPQSPPIPSREDEYCTSLIKQALSMVDIELIDHIIVGEGKFQSMNNLHIM